MLTGGVPVWRDRQAPMFFESPQQLQALGLSRDSTAAVYRFFTAEGGRSNVACSACRPDQIARTPAFTACCCPAAGALRHGPCGRA